MNEIDIGSAPGDEDCAQVGSENYAARARKECARYIAALRKKYGVEPGGAMLRVKSNPHDFGSYYSVVCRYDETDKEAVEYAYKVENGLQTWAEAGMGYDPKKHWPEDPKKLAGYDEPANRFDAYAATIAAKLLGLSDEKRDNLDKNMAATMDELIAYQKLQSITSAAGQISLDEAMWLYKRIGGEYPDPDKWAALPLEERVTITQIMAELLKARSQVS